MAAEPALDALPGYRRRFVVTPHAGKVRADLEDDVHCMSVTIHHDAGIATALVPEMDRWPWTTCPGAEAVLRETFTGIALGDFARRGEKVRNCTHLHDLATLAAAHAYDDRPLVYDVLGADPIDGRRDVEVRRDGEPLMRWTIAGHSRLIAPPEVAGQTLTKLPFIDRLDPPMREAARILRWAAIVATGRMMPLDQQSDATKLPAGCFSFQPGVREQAVRIGVVRDFSTGDAAPLDGRAQVVDR